MRDAISGAIWGFWGLVILAAVGTLALVGFVVFLMRHVSVSWVS